MYSTPEESKQASNVSDPTPNNETLMPTISFTALTFKARWDFFKIFLEAAVFSLWCGDIKLTIPVQRKDIFEQ